MVIYFYEKYYQSKLLTSSSFRLSLIEFEEFLSSVVCAHSHISPLQLAVFIHPTETKMNGEVITIEIDEELAYKSAQENKSRIIEFEVRKLESEKNIAVAKSSNRYGADLVASYGFANSSTNFSTLYSNTLNQQGIRLAVNIPIWNGGKNRSDVKIALANNELTQLSIEQNELNFEQEIKLFLNQFRLVEDQLKISFESDVIAEKRYDIAVKRYMIGKTGITDLNIALLEKNQAKRSLMQQLKNYWDSYYRLRFYTLYDFESNTEVSYELPGM